MEKRALTQYIEFNNDRFTKRLIFNDNDSTVFVLNFQPGQSLPTHKHPGTNVYVHVLTGSGLFTIDSKEIHAQKDDIMLVNGDEELSFMNNGSTNVSLYVVLNNLPNEKYAQDI